MKIKTISIEFLDVGDETVIEAADFVEADQTVMAHVEKNHPEWTSLSLFMTVQFDTGLSWQKTVLTYPDRLS